MMINTNIWPSSPHPQHIKSQLIFSKNKIKIAAADHSACDLTRSKDRQGKWKMN